MRTFKTLPRKFLPAKFDSTKTFIVTRAQRIGNYFYNIFNDYKVVAVETLQEMKLKPIKSSAYITAIGTVGVLIKTNPSESDFKVNLMENANDLSLVGQPVRSPKSEKYIKFLLDNFKDRKLIYVNLGVCSLIYEDNYTQDVDLYFARCSKLKVRWLDFYKSIVDVGVIGYWLNMSKLMVDYDVNEDEWDEKGQPKIK